MRTLLHLWRNKSGVAMIEFAFALPVLLIVLLGGLEIANYIYMTQKMQSAAYNVLNLINAQSSIKPGDDQAVLQPIAAIVPQVFVPFTVGNGDYRVVITAIQRDALGGGPVGPQPYMRWQVTQGGGVGETRFNHQHCSPPQENVVDADQVNNYQFEAGDQLVTVELFVRYQPLLDNAMTRSIIGITDNEILSAFVSSRPRKSAFLYNPYDCS